MVPFLEKFGEADSDAVGEHAVGVVLGFQGADEAAFATIEVGEWAVQGLALIRLPGRRPGGRLVLEVGAETVLALGAEDAGGEEPVDGSDEQVVADVDGGWMAGETISAAGVIQRGPCSCSRRA
jgi:hypothetical protein